MYTPSGTGRTLPSHSARRSGVNASYLHLPSETTISQSLAASLIFLYAVGFPPMASPSSSQVHPFCFSLPHFRAACPLSVVDAGLPPALLSLALPLIMGRARQRVWIAS